MSKPRPDPAGVIAARLLKHLANLRDMQRRLELLMPKLQNAITETQNLAVAFEKVKHDSSSMRR